jgi:hypothetical protein
MIKYFILEGIALSFLATVVHAESACEKKAAEKNLSGTEKVTFIANCEKEGAGSATSDAAKHCAKQAKDKGLSGAAKKSFVQQCAKDAAGHHK